ncbi:hypothetical protein [Geodermatophilus sp. SYSU D00815]
MSALLVGLSMGVCALAVAGGAWFLETTPPLGFALVGAGVLFGVLGVVLVHTAPRRPTVAPPPAGKGSAAPEAANAVGAFLDALR